MSQYNAPNVGMAVVTPEDRIRWGPIWGGIFAALSTLILLSVLGAAIGLSSYDAGADARDVSTGAGIWAAISAIVAFFLGGWIAARTAAFRGRWHALLNGAMVWAVAIPLAMLLLGGSAALLGSGLAANPDASARVNDRQNEVGDAQQAGATMSDMLTPQITEQTADTATSAAWWTLVSLLVGLGAAAFGGYLGHRAYDEGRTRYDHDRGSPAVT